MARPDPGRRGIATLLRVALAGTLALAGLAHAATAPPPVVTWSDLRADNTQARPLVAAQYPGDASGGIVDEVDDALAFEGRLGRAHGSAWAVAGVDIPAGGAAPGDLSAMRVLALELSADREMTLRIRIKGPDVRKQRLGCYPALEVRATPTPRQWVLPLSEFRVERYCERGGVSVNTSLEQLSSVEVTAFEADDKPWRFRVERVQFAASDVALAQADEAEAARVAAPVVATTITSVATLPSPKPVVEPPPTPMQMAEAPRASPAAAPVQAPAVPAPARVAARPPRPASSPSALAKPKITCVKREDWQLALCY